VTIRKGLPAKLALTDADDTRYLFSGLVVCNVDGSPRGGVLSPVNVNLVTSSATMNVSVARFQGAAVRDGGVILLANDGAANVLLDAAPGANSRIDVIYSKQNDASGTVTVPDANNTALLTFVKGTAGAVPVKPTLPVGALELATVLIPSGATATNSAGVVITQTAAFTAAAGATVSFRTKVALDLFTTAQKDQQAVVLADSGRWSWSGSSWVAASASVNRQKDTTNSFVAASPQFGVGKITGTASASIFETITFPVAFVGVPSVVVSAGSGRTPQGAFNEVGVGGITGKEVASRYSITTTGFTLSISLTSGTNLNSSYDYYYDWIAYGVLA
jgi:hypothetical protein